MRSPKQTSGQRDSSSRAIREFLAKAGEVYSKLLTPALVAIFLEQLGQYSAEVLAPLFRLVFATCKFFPTPADVLAPLKRAEEAYGPLESERKWEQVLAYAVRLSPDFPDRNHPRISDRTMTAICAAGGLDYLRDCEQESLQWARKRFIETYTAWSTLEKNQFLWPDGELKNLIAGAAQKLLPEAKP